MPRTLKYEPLRAWLTLQRGSKVSTSFSKLDELVGGLPFSARRYPAYWYGTAVGAPTHTWKAAWEAAGFVVDSFDLSEELVTFRRV